MDETEEGPSSQSASRCPNLESLSLLEGNQVRSDTRLGQQEAQTIVISDAWAPDDGCDGVNLLA
jgi:hypothetical protein